eukprot:TRINITY_DN67931_c7_g1_i2.p1 TRINITY_DN67931_c7_g1~~TRINITY_DN67931_c7_g1_i2.p1  ORF type:complete len:854 (-),score=42.88 TRINITY_DN67931_c7_g1_i2:116-2377(-)
MRTDLTGRQAHTNQEVLDCIHTPLSGVKADMDNWKKICCLYGIPYVCLRDQRATWSNILATLNHFGVMTACDQILLVLCGHGIPAAGDRPYGWFCCYDKPMTYNQMKGTLQQGQQGDHPRKVAFLVDTCFSGRATVADGVQWRGKKETSKKITAAFSPTTQAFESAVTPSSRTKTEEFSVHRTKEEILSFVGDNYPLHGFEIFTAVDANGFSMETPHGGEFTAAIAKVLLQPDLLKATDTTLATLQELMRSRRTLGSAQLVSIPTGEMRNDGQFQFMYSLNSVTGYTTEELGRQAGLSFFRQNGIHTAELVKELLDRGYGPHQQDIDVLRLGNDIDLKVYCSTEDERNALSVVINPRRRGLHTEPDVAPDTNCAHQWMKFRPDCVSAQSLGSCNRVNALHGGTHVVPPAAMQVHVSTVITLHDELHEPCEAYTAGEQCAAYDALLQGECSWAAMHHMQEYSHPVAPCPKEEQCEAHQRLIEGDASHELQDSCHELAFYHPPRNTMLCVDNGDDTLRPLKGLRNPAAGASEQWKRDWYSNGRDDPNEQQVALKREITENNWSDHWDATLPFAQRHLDHPKHKSLGRPLNVAHILAIMFYTGSKIQRDMHHSLTSVEENAHEHYSQRWYVLDEILQQAVMKLSDANTKTTGTRLNVQLFRGLNKTQPADHSQRYIWPFMSFSWKKSIAKRFLKSEGLLLHANPTTQLRSGWFADVSWLSKFHYECEVLGVGLWASFSAPSWADSNGVIKKQTMVQ